MWNWNKNSHINLRKTLKIKTGENDTLRKVPLYLHTLITGFKTKSCGNFQLELKPENISKWGRDQSCSMLCIVNAGEESNLYRE